MPKIDIRLETSADTSGVGRLERALGTLGTRLTSFAQSMASGLGVSVMQRTVGALESTLKGAYDNAFGLAEEIHKGAKALGVSTDAYQVLGAVMRQSGGDADQLGKSVAKMNLSLFEARDVGSKAAGAYRALGLSVAELEKIPYEQRLERIGRATLDSKDKTAAFAAASEILGARNLPIVLSALQTLAKDGFGNLNEAMAKSGRLMSESTIARLYEAEKQIARFKKTVTIGVGESVGAAFSVGESFKSSPWETLKSMLSAGFVGPSGVGLLAGTVAKNTVAPKPETPPDNGEAERLRLQMEAQADAAHKLALAQVALKDIENNPNTTEWQKRDKIIAALIEEVKLRNILEGAVRASDLRTDETDKERALKLAKMRQETDAIVKRVLFLQSQSDQFDSRRQSRESFEKFQADGGQGGADFRGSAIQAAQNWIVKTGSLASQVAQSIESTLGTVVSSISDGILSWVDGTKTFGQAMAQIGSTILRAILGDIVQIGVKMMLNAVLNRALTAANIAANLATTAAASSALAAMWAVPATLATIATMGGAAAQAPASIMSAEAITLSTSGFADGGMTGGNRRDRVAGFVHEGEWVAPQWMVNHPGFGHLIAGLENARAGGAGFALGGFTSPTRALTRPAYVQQENVRPVINILLDPAGFARLQQEHSEQWFEQMTARHMRRNS